MALGSQGKRRIRVAVAAPIAFWALLVAGGFSLVLAHSSTAGQLGNAPAVWPEATTLRAPSDRALIVMWVHPRCPCTRASLRELARLLARVGSDASALVVMNTPEAPSPDWESGESWRLARSIPGVTVVADPGGVETQRFGALTSGHVLLYSRSGKLLFSGGITPGRAHEGSSAGQQAIVDALSGAPRSFTTRVFGCELFKND